MRFIIIITVFFAFKVFSGEPNSKSCNLQESECLLDDDFSTETIKDGLTSLWAQKMIGIDLSKKFLITLDDTRKVNIGVWDDGFNIPSILGTSKELNHCLHDHRCKMVTLGPDDSEVDSHGTYVANLITGYFKISGGVNGQISVLQSISGNKNYSNMAKDLVGNSMIYPEIINVSHDNKPSYYEAKNSNALSQLVHDVLFVCASGNYHPSVAEKSNDNYCIQVGSVSFDGSISPFSMEGEGVAVLAPSDMNMTSTILGRREIFGGTSGASPLVAGILGDFISIFKKKKQFSSKQKIKIILNNTSVKTKQISKTKNGSGIINPLKIFKVGERLRGKKYNLSDPSLYNFDNEVTQLQINANVLLESTNCDNRRKGFNLLREAFFLASDVERSKIAKYMNKLYVENGAYKNARYYQQFYSQSQEKYFKVILELSPFEQEGYARYWFDMQRPDIETLQKIFLKLSPEGKFGVLKELALEKRGKILFDLSKKSSEQYRNMTKLSELSNYLYKRFYLK